MQKNIPFLVLCSLALSAAWMLSGLDSPLPWQTRYDDARVIQSLGLALVLALALASPSASARSFLRWPPWTRIGIAVALILGLASASRSDWPSYGFIDVTMMLALLISALTVSGHASDQPRLRNLALSIAAFGAGAMGLRFGSEYLAAVVTGTASELEYSWMPYTNPRYFAKAATWALPLLWLAPAMTMRWPRGLKSGSWIMAVLIWSQLLGSGSRGALLGMAAGIITAAILFGRCGRAYALWQLTSATTGLLLWSLFVRFYNIAAPEHIASTGMSGREDLYQAALADIGSAPLLGIGPMHYSELGRHAATSVAGTHNFPLQIAAEWGLPAAILILAALLYLAGSLLRETRLSASDADAGIDQKIRVALFGAIAAAMVHGLFANVANEPISQTLAVLLIGLFPFRAATSDATGPASVSRAKSALLAGLVLLAGAGIALNLLKGWACVGSPDRNDYVTGINGSVYPRLWSQGLIPLEQTCHTGAPADSSQSVGQAGPS